MRPFIENFPFFSIFLAILAGILTATIRSGRAAYWVTIGVCAASAVLNAFVLEYTYLGDLSFTYTMGRFLAPYGNAIKCGPLQALFPALTRHLYDETKIRTADLAVMVTLMFLCTVYLVNNTYNPFIYFRF